MVLSINIPLKKSEQDVVDFLLGLVFISQKKQNTAGSRQKFLHHDVYSASKLISWILQRSISTDQVAYSGQQKTWRVVCNLMYGNTIVLKHQVSRLLHDALRAREIVAFSTVLMQEEERKKRMLALIQKANDEFETPKKKRKADKMQMDEYLMAPPTPISTALKQNITMPDVFGFQQVDENQFQDDDLEPVDAQQLELMFGMLDGNSDDPTTMLDRTFIDNFTSSDKNRAPAIELDLDLDLPRPNEEFIQNQMMTPTKDRALALSPIEEEIYEPASSLRDILLYGRLPLAEERKSLEDEMEEARNSAINNESQGENQANLSVPRLTSEQIELDTNVTLPPSATKTPRGSAMKRTGIRGSVEEKDAINHKVPLKEMSRLMDDFSSLVHKDVSALQVNLHLPEPLTSLLSPIPFSMRRHSNKNLWKLFPRRFNKYDKSVANNESEEEEEEPSEKRPKIDDMEPIEMSQLFNGHVGLQSPVRPLDPIEDLEFPRQQNQSDFEFIQPLPLSPIVPMTPVKAPAGDPNCKSAATIRENILNECQEWSPHPVKFDSLLGDNVSRREAARTFYVTLELLKERALESYQSSPFSEITIRLSGHDSDDIEDLANIE